MLNISTKTGDQGDTGLADGQRVAKSDLRIEAIGTLDEVNSWLGLVVVELEKSLNRKNDVDIRRKLIQAEKEFVLQMQNHLFSLGAELAQVKQEQLNDQVLVQLETHANSLSKELGDDWPKEFLLPGGSKIGANLDLARSVCRRLERRLVALHQQSQLRPVVLKTINRLSDYLYLLRCYANILEETTEKKFKPESK